MYITLAGNYSRYLDAANSVPCDLMAKGAPVPTVRLTPTKHPPPLQRADLLRALDNYTAALTAITKAQDRADFDNAAAKVSAAVGALAQSAPGPYGAAAAPVAKASTNAVLWLVGQDLDYRRLHELQNATRIACEPMHVLANALGVVLAEQPEAPLRGVFGAMVQSI